MATDGAEKRKLAAIMFTDIVDWTVLVERDEMQALELGEEHRRMLRELFPRFDGLEIETAGDEFLVEFESTLHAVRCAIEIQRALATRNLAVAPEHQVELRIGIHVGDVVHKDSKIMGNTVNIAARLRPLAERGGICVSGDVARQIPHNVASCETLGWKELKNVVSPIEVFRILLPCKTKSSAPVVPVMPTSSVSWTHPGNIDYNANINHTDDGDIHVQGKIDGGSTATLISNHGSITIDGKIDGGSSVTLVAEGDIRIGVVGWAGDRKIAGGSHVDAQSSKGSISLGNKIEHSGTDVSFSAQTGIDIGNKIGGGCTVRLKTASGIIHVHDKIDGAGTHVTYWPPGSLVVDRGIKNRHVKELNW